MSLTGLPFYVSLKTVFHRSELLSFLMEAQLEIVLLNLSAFETSASDSAANQNSSIIAKSVPGHTKVCALFYLIVETFTYREEDPLRKVSVVVIDGVTVGHPCCGVPNCKVPLDNNRHRLVFNCQLSTIDSNLMVELEFLWNRFCPDHLNLNSTCAIIGCSNQVIPGRRCCFYQEHQAIETVHNDRGQARFQLKERYECAHLAHPDDSVGNEVTSINEIVEDDEEQSFEPSNNGQPIPVIPNSDAAARKPRIRAQFGRRRTHNEQLFVAPCGMIIARETFFFAEALYSVIVS